MPEIKNWITGETILTYEGDLRAAVVEAVQKGVLLTQANLVRANLVRANLYGANLYGASLVRANLYGANLYGANLYGANLDGANLDGANLYGASLVRANLYGANLYGANLDGANLDGQRIIDGGLRSDGYRFWLTGFAEEGWRIKAGCRNFSIADARTHWQLRRGGTQLGEETFAILDHLDRMAGVRGWDLTQPPPQPAASQPTEAVTTGPREEADPTG